MYTWQFVLCRIARPVEQADQRNWLTKTTWAYHCLFGLMFFLPGCGPGFARVGGHVTIDGKPVSAGSNVRGTVCFHPENDSTAPAVGLVDAEGHYEMMTGTSRGVMPGAYQVTVSATEIVPAASPGEAPSGRRLSSLQYTDPKKSGLRVEVKPGRNTFDLSIESAAADPARNSNRRLN